MFGLKPVDIIVIFLYFFAIIAIGLRAMKHISNQEDYFLGGRRFGKLVQIFAAFGQGTSADSAVGTTTTTFNNGASGIWSALLFLWGTPIYWFTSPWYRRLRLITLGDFFEERYGSKAMAGFYSIIASLFLMSFIAIGTKAVSATVLGVSQKPHTELTSIELEEYNQAVELDQLREKHAQKQLTGTRLVRLYDLEHIKPRKEFSYINETVLVWIICIIVFIYAIAGGLEAAMYTDMLQGIFIILLSIILIPFGLARVNAVNGGSGAMEAIETIHRRLPEWYFDIFGSAQTVDFTWYYIASISVLIAINVAVQANQMNAIGSAKDELTARIGFTAGCFMKRFCTVLWGVTGLIAIALYSHQIENSDLVWGHATRDLLGGLGLGLVGLMIACLLAALMSSADMMMITASGVLTRNLFKPIFPNLDEKSYVTVGRIVGGVVLIGSVLLACWFDTILQLLKFIWEFNAILAAAFWCGMKWRRATRYGAWASMIVTMLIFALVPILLPVIYKPVKTNEYLLKTSHTEPITRTYTTRQMDVDSRNEEIRKWQLLDEDTRAQILMPQPPETGMQITRTIIPPAKSVFWSKGTRQVDGTVQGNGMLYVEMVIVDQFIDLSTMPYAMTETIRTLIKIILPFSVIIIISLLTPADDANRLNRFYVKMRTEVIVDRQRDMAELEKSYSNPARFSERLIFPDSSFEFFKWNKVDTIGFLISAATVFGIIGFLYLLINIGS